MRDEPVRDQVAMAKVFLPHVLTGSEVPLRSLAARFLAYEASRLSTVPLSIGLQKPWPYPHDDHLEGQSRGWTAREARAVVPWSHWALAS